MTGQAEGVIRSIRRTLRLLVIATAVLYVILGAAAYWTWHEASRSRDALCSLRSDLERRNASSRSFLLHHPRGIPGIPTPTITQGIANAQRTITALAPLSCPVTRA